MAPPMGLRELLHRIRAAACGRLSMAAPVTARARACAHARGRAIRSCARARGRALRAEAEAVASCAEARARVVRAYLLHAQRQAGAAAAIAGRRLRQSTDSAASTLLRVAYGESPPKIPTYLELLKMVEQRMLDIEGMLSLANKIVKLNDIFNLISPYSTSFIIAIIITPIALYYQDVISTAPETSCPFLGISSIVFDGEFPVKEGLAAVIHLSARVSGLAMLFAGGLFLCMCRDIGTVVVGILGQDCYMTLECSEHGLTYTEVRSVGWGEQQPF